MNITIESMRSNNILELVGPCQLIGAQSTATTWCPMTVNSTALSEWTTLSTNLTNSVLEAHTHYTLRIIVSNAFGNASTDAFNFSKL